ncbi:MAG TPA: endo-1,4-beta-xylanase [Lacipirellulaceae bacterium]|nr:endo-1,4-beta-xylanase [Lacipirellulaceae bacterium]
MRLWHLCVFWLVVGCTAHVARAQAVLSGSSLALKSTGSGFGTWTLDRDGYVGTYITVPTAGDVTVRVNASGTASGGIDPHMNIVLADTKAGFDVAGGVHSYESTFNLPAGTYFLRTEFNNDPAASSRALAVQDVTLTGASFANSSNSTNAMAAADTYIQNFRKGDVKIGLSGLAPGTNVAVSMKRIAFNFGTAVPGVSSFDVNNYVGNNGTAKQINYQARLNQNFNAVVPENAGKWAYNESARDVPTMSAVDQILNYAQAHDMQARMHNLIWGDNSNNGQQPSWVLNSDSASGLLDKAFLGTDPNAANDLRNEISERIDYYVGTGTASDRAQKYSELDVYNESYHTGENPSLSPSLKHNYWNVYGATGVADIYREVRDTIAASGAKTKLFVNEYGALGGTDYANWYVQHIEGIRQAATAAGYGEVIGGIGLQDYTGGSQNAGNVMSALQNLSVQGLPLTLTEFGVNSGASQTAAASILGDTLRLVFGTPDAGGFFMWGFHQESGAGANSLFAPAAALYTVNTSDFTTWTLTPAGQTWQDLLGIQDWDGNPDNGWTTQTSAVVGPDGSINFNGFWGDYDLTINGQTYHVTLSKGTSQYSLVVAAGDYNGDHVVDSADYLVWRRSVGSTTDLRADGNGDGVVDDKDYGVWRSAFGTVYSGGSGASLSSAPEPGAVFLIVAGGLGILGLRKRRCRRAALRLGGSLARPCR